MPTLGRAKRGQRRRAQIGANVCSPNLPRGAIFFLRMATICDARRRGATFGAQHSSTPRGRFSTRRRRSGSCLAHCVAWFWLRCARCAMARTSPAPAAVVDLCAGIEKPAADFAGGARSTAGWVVFLVVAPLLAAGLQVVGVEVGQAGGHLAEFAAGYFVAVGFGSDVQGRRAVVV